MGKMKDLTGQKFKRLTVICEHGRDKWGQVVWMCKCECGNISYVCGSSLRNGITKSCGCWNIEALSMRVKHGMSNSGVYNSWGHIINRCYNKQNSRYKYYGGRGIKVCERWKNFDNFYADMGDKPEGYTIERINNDGNYELSNCRWATIAEQNRNNSRTRLIEYNGEIKCMSEWGRFFNIPKTTLKHRLDRYSPEIAFNM